ncbi:MAG TPA: hypothetical protein VK978_04470 [Candidatus Saccharimonadales bacterium]|nr:hypothetical protein [Candidatus Saccharimonadales bacterium]
MIVGAAGAQAVTRAYNTDTPLQRGMIVRVAEKDGTKVEALKSKDMEKMEGVIVAANDAPVTLSAVDAQKQQVFVATTGRYSILVSNQNGPIKKDDYVTISALAGVGMKAGGEQSRIIGKALGGFDGQKNISGKTTVQNAQKQNVPITIGLIPVEINISHNPLEAKPESILPGYEYLQRMAGSVAGKPVPPLQLYVSLIALILTTAISGSIIYAGVRTSLTAVGRNPLAKSSIMRNLLQVVLTGIIILIIGVVAVYLILKL